MIVRSHRPAVPLARGALLVLLGWLIAVPVAWAQPANADALRRATRAALAASFADDLPRLRIEVKRASGEASTVDKPRVSFRSMDRLPRGAAQVQVYQRTNGQWTRAGWALLHVAHYDSVLVTTRTIGPGDAITHDDVRVTWRETTRFRGMPLSAAIFQQDDPLRADRHLQAGRMLREHDVRPPYAVDTGQTVTVQYQRGGLRMLLRCKAREPGFVGDVIRVYAPDNDTAYRARLTAAGRATWIETL
jgi:flagella basal body P-ring formation protein FlgA